MGEHRNLNVNNFLIGPNVITFEENVCKTFHGGITDLKYIPRKVEHECHRRGEKHERCLVELYWLYMGLVEVHVKVKDSFYFKPSANKMAFQRMPVDINTLNSILPELCKAVGIKRKTAHSLRVTCVSTLFNNGVEEKLIRERSGHRSNALFRYEKASKEQLKNVSFLLGPNKKVSVTENKDDKPAVNLEGDLTKSTVNVEGRGLSSFFHSASFANCEVNVFVDERK